MNNSHEDRGVNGSPANETNECAVICDNRQLRVVRQHRLHGLYAKAHIPTLRICAKTHPTQLYLVISTIPNPTRQAF